MKDTLVIRYELFQKLIAHLQSAVSELRERIEHIRDEKKQEEISWFINESNQLIHEALIGTNTRDTCAPPTLMQKKQGSWRKEVDTMKELLEKTNELPRSKLTGYQPSRTAKAAL